MYKSACWKLNQALPLKHSGSDVNGEEAGQSSRQQLPALSPSQGQAEARNLKPQN
jgi:hypothetical protein